MRRRGAAGQVRDQVPKQGVRYGVETDAVRDVELAEDEAPGAFLDFP